MFFKKMTSLVLLLSLLSSCSWLRDQPKTQKSFNSSELDLSCLRVMPSQLQQLFAGRYTASPEDQESVKSIWTCLDRSLNTFSKYTHGASSEYYTADELRDFANRYLPEDSLFSSNLVLSIFKLKTAVLGGTSDKLTQSEILKLRAKLNKFGEIIAPLAPYISTLLKPYNSFVNDKVKPGDVLNQFINDFATLLADSENTVTWQDLSCFVAELEKYLKSPNPTALTVVKEQIQVFQYLKVLVVGGDEQGIEKTKWQPIFKSISAIYNALYMTTTSSDMMNQLGIEIQSTDEEQKTATAKLSSVLQNLKNDPTLYSKSTISLLADRWSKVLILNAFLYPKSQDKLAVKEFLGSSTLRNTTASLMDELMAVKAGDQNVKLIAKMASDLASIIEETSTAQNSTLNISDLRSYAAQLKPLFADAGDYQTIDSALSILQDVSAILIGKDSGNLSGKDFGVLIQKASDLYTAWRTSDPVDFNSALSQSLNVLIRQPSASTVSVKQIQSLLDKCENLFAKMNFTSGINWALIKKMVTDGAKLKSILFANTDQSITNNELTQIYKTWNAFSANKDIDQTLENLSTFFKTNPYASVKIVDLLKAVDAFLPDNEKLSKIGITSDLVGSLKAFLIGGQSGILEKSEYTKVAQIAYTVFKELKPVLKTLPKDFKLGLNSQTFALISAGVQGLIDDKTYVFSNSALKELILSQAKASGLKVQPQTVDKLLIGLNYRIFEGNKGKKPASYPATFSSSKLIGLQQFLEKTKLDYEDYEKAFAGVPSSQSLPGSDLFRTLTRPGTKYVLANLQPIVSGKTMMPFFTGKGKAQTDYYQVDLNYKSLIFNGLLWIFPAYEIETDSSRSANLPRLSMADLVDLFVDINDLVYELGLSFSPDPADVSAAARMQTINLFTRTGNGDEFIDVIETVDFLTTTFGGMNLLEEVRKDLVKSCYPQNTNYTTQTEFSMACLKNSFFGKREFEGFYQKVVPLMSAHFEGLNASDTEQYRKSTLTAVKAGWTEDSSLNLNDLETLVSIPYYIENIFLRLDHNYDGILTFTEAMSGFPVFCREIKKAAGSSIKGSCEPGEDPRQVEAIYGHLIMKGTPPETIKPGDSIIQKMTVAKDFLSWLVYWNHLDRNPDVRDHLPPFLQRKDLLDIISNLSTTIAPTPPPAQPSANASFE